MLSRIAVLVASVALTGCIAMSPEQRRAADDALCRSYGFRPNTDAFAECLQRIDIARWADGTAYFYSLNLDRPLYLY